MHILWYKLWSSVWRESFPICLLIASLWLEKEERWEQLMIYTWRRSFLKKGSFQGSNPCERHWKFTLLPPEARLCPLDKQFRLISNNFSSKIFIHSCCSVMGYKCDRLFLWRPVMMAMWMIVSINNNKTINQNGMLLARVYGFLEKIDRFQTIRIVSTIGVGEGSIYKGTSLY